MRLFYLKIISLTKAIKPLQFKFINMKTLIAKTKVAEVTDYGNNNKKTRLSRPDGSSEENKTFSQFTPQISVEILVNNPEAVDFFNAGDEVYLTFSKERQSDSNKLLALLTNAFIVGYHFSKEMNLFKVIACELSKNGIKTFYATYPENDNIESHVTDIDFLTRQLSDNDLNTAKTCPVDDTFTIFSKGIKIDLKRLT